MRRLTAAGLGLFGLLGAHELTYRIVGGAHRDELLASTGHGWTSQIGLLLLAAAAALSIGTLGGHGKPRQVRYRTVAIIQVLGYSAIEILERAASGHHVVPSLSLVLVGAALQIPVSAVIWWVYEFTLQIIGSLFFAFAPVHTLVERTRTTTPFASPFHSVAVLPGSGPRAPPVACA